MSCAVKLDKNHQLVKKKIEKEQMKIHLRETVNFILKIIILKTVKLNGKRVLIYGRKKLINLHLRDSQIQDIKRSQDVDFIVYLIFICQSNEI